ncbi:IMPACT family protein [Amantichitinum ursilacus]|uniref:IMPACT family member YigZ n=1 Tax=Amantichitinum ursilacus TaxID=857265 RepID=A0A0N1JTL1_9NEIS|nr:YigZ family protein [Amantichitinum ursilacus]KPC54029.1 IMPACT family member YigZ [Amantichitinum ursilacus]
MPVFTLAQPVHTELEIKKSRFLGSVLPVADRASALALIEQTRVAHPTATHVCWALLAGGQSGMSDDGEPSGTAGRPMLEVLRHQHVDGVLATVVRYYGGVKLGAGGLVRAYTDAIAKAMQQATLVERIAQLRLNVEVDYADEARVRHWLGGNGYALVEADHGLRVKMVIELPETAAAHAHDQLRDLTQGRARITDT